MTLLKHKPVDYNLQKEYDMVSSYNHVNEDGTVDITTPKSINDFDRVTNETSSWMLSKCIIGGSLMNFSGKREDFIGTMKSCGTHTADYFIRKVCEYVKESKYLIDIKCHYKFDKDRYVISVTHFVGRTGSIAAFELWL